MYYVWDENKNILNYKKHGITFDTAIQVFNDPNHVEYYDDQHSTSEDRYIAIGLVGQVLFVVFTERKNSIRLISARPATKVEEETYYDGYLYS